MSKEGRLSLKRSTTRQTLGILASPVENRRLPAPDVMGYFADRLVYRDSLELVSDHIHENWPDVIAVHCGVYSNTPCFSIHLSPFSRESQLAHWPLADWIKMALHSDDFYFFFLPPTSQRLPSDFTIYEKQFRSG